MPPRRRAPARESVFVATNAAMLLTALIGQYIYLHIYLHIYLRNGHATGGGTGTQAKKPYSARG